MQGITNVLMVPFNTEASSTTYFPIARMPSTGPAGTPINMSKSPPIGGEVPIRYDPNTEVIIDTIKYKEKLKAVFLVNSPYGGSWEFKNNLIKWIWSNDPPKQLEARAQGNDNPLHFFWGHVFMIHKIGTTTKYYDPSYAAKGSSYHPDMNELFAEYTQKNLAAVIEVCIPKKGGKKFKDNIPMNLFLFLSHILQLLLKVMFLDLSIIISLKIWKTIS